MHFNWIKQFFFVNNIFLHSVVHKKTLLPDFLHLIIQCNSWYYCLLVKVQFFFTFCVKNGKSFCKRKKNSRKKRLIFFKLIKQENNFKEPVSHEWLFSLCCDDTNWQVNVQIYFHNVQLTKNSLDYLNKKNHWIVYFIYMSNRRKHIKLNISNMWKYQTCDNTKQIGDMTVLNNNIFKIS